MNRTNVNESSPTTIDVDRIRLDFPILEQKIYRAQKLIYLDSGASTQRPRTVIDAMSSLYESNYANVHRGIHYLSERASELYEQARSSVQELIGAPHSDEIIFTSGTTLAINLVARAWGDDCVRAGDEILLSLMEHHSNIVPWQQLAARTGATVRFVGITDRGELDLDDFDSKLNGKTKIIAITAVSNVLGTVNPIADIVHKARQHGALVLVDAAQHVPHEPTRVTDWDADFVVFSAHKMLGPSGLGILYGRRELLETMPPFLGGGSMISTVTVDGFTPGELPAKFEAGTPPIAEAIGLTAAIAYLKAIGFEAISKHERQLTQRAFDHLSAIEGLEILGPPPAQRSGIVSFVIEGLSPQDLSIFLDRKGVAIRAGHHCAMPLHEHLGISSSCRASFYLYNSLDEVDQFAEILLGVIAKLRG